MQPLVSVIIPFYKNKIWLKEAIKSVLNQTYCNLEIILINDGSDENIEDIECMYKDKVIYIYQQNKGAGNARNKGINIAKGEYIAFLDSDDLWNNSKIEKQLKYMLEENIVWSHTSYCKFWDNGKIKRVNVSKYKNNIFPMSIISCPIATPCVMIKNSILKEDKELRFLENISAGEDSYLWFKLSKKYKLGLLNENLSKVRIRGNNTAKLAYEQIKAKSIIWKYIQQNSEFKNLKISLYIKFAFKVCESSFIVLKNMDNKKVNKNIIEITSKIMYLIPWILFKIAKIDFINKIN